MTTSDPNKVLNQIKGKPAKSIKFQKHNLPKKRAHGKALKKCKLCGRNGAHINKYGLDLCRQCFRDGASKLGFKKYN